MRDEQQPTIAQGLTASERKQAELLQHPGARQRFAGTRTALRQILSGYLNCSPLEIAFETFASGKPRLAGPWRDRIDLRFNVAHSGDVALVAVVLGYEVGIDVEQLRQVGQLEQLAQRYFHPQEIASVLATPAETRAAAFLQCWTCKEAVLKAVGSGISAALDKFAVPLEPAQARMLKLKPCSGHERCWVEPLALDDDYLGAIACVGPRPHVQWRHFPADCLSRPQALNDQ